MKKRTQLMAAVLAMILHAGILGIADETDDSCACVERDLGGRLTVGFEQAPVPMVTSVLAFGFGQPGFTVSAWCEVDDLPSPSASAGARLSVVRDWLSLSILRGQSSASRGLSVLADAAPPSWLLLNANPAIASAVSARIEAPVLGKRVPPEASLTPSIIVISPIHGSLLTCALSTALQLDPGSASIRIPSTTIAATYSIGPAALSASIGFTGLTTSIASAGLTVGVADWGLEFAANVTPSGFGSLFYSVTVSLQWGDSYLLPPEASQEGSSTCPGGICY